MGLKQVEKVRQRIAHGLNREIVGIRSFLSLTEGNQEAIERLRGEQHELVLASLTEAVLMHLGNPPTVEPPTSPNSAARRTVRKLVGG